MLCSFHFTFQDKVIEYFQYYVNSSFFSKIPIKASKFLSCLLF